MLRKKTLLRVLCVFAIVTLLGAVPLFAATEEVEIIGTVFDGITRHTKEGHEFRQYAAKAGFKEAVRRRDEPFGDFGPSTFKG